MSEKSVLFDATRCTACRGCQVACKQWNELKATSTLCQGTYENPPDLSPNTWLTIRFGEEMRGDSMNWLFSRRSCMHCTDAACVDVCPTGAVFHNEFGFVAYDKAKCIGCGYCVEFCPFHVPRLDANTVTGLGKMDKCTLCTTPGLDRLSIGQEPACVKTCPPEALMYGDREKLLAEGRRRVASLKSTRPGAGLYGETQLGGLHILYVLADSPQAYGLPAEPAYPVTASIQRGVFRPFAWVLWGVVAVGLAANAVVARARQKHHEEEG